MGGLLSNLVWQQQLIIDISFEPLKCMNILHSANFGQFDLKAFSHCMWIVPQLKLDSSGIAVCFPCWIEPMFYIVNCSAGTSTLPIVIACWIPTQFKTMYYFSNHKIYVKLFIEHKISVYSAWLNTFCIEWRQPVKHTHGITLKYLFGQNESVLVWRVDLHLL